MNKNYFFSVTLFGFYLLFCSCTSNFVRKNGFGGVTKSKFDNYGILVEDSVFDKKNKVIKVVSYYTDRKIKSETSFDSLSNKIAKTYFFLEEAKVKKKEFFKNNLIDSFCQEYYINGNKKNQQFYFDGKRAFEYSEYNENGKIEKYEFLDPDGIAHLIVAYDTLGNPTTFTGNPFFECYLDLAENLTLKIGDSLKATFYIPNPPKCKVLLRSMKNDKKGTDALEIRNFKLETYYNALQVGDFKMTLRLEIIDSVNWKSFNSKLYYLNFKVVK